MTIPKHFLVLACAVLLALSACTKTKRVGDPAAQEALTELRTSLAAAQAALAETTTGDREQARAALAGVLDSLQEELGEQPDSAAKTAIVQAVGAVETAVEAVNGALEASAAMASGGRFLREHARHAGLGSGGAERRS